MEISIRDDDASIDGAQLPDTDQLSICNSFAHSMFSEIICELCSVPISGSLLKVKSRVAELYHLFFRSQSTLRFESIYFTELQSIKNHQTS